MKTKALILIALSGVIITLDQATKMYILSEFQLHERFEVIEGYFNITHVRNQGAAFGILANSHPSFRNLFFLAMPPVALLIILLLLRGVPDKDRWQIVALCSVFGGAIGNYIDRIRFRYVIDFLDFHYKHHYTWPAFNVADIAIVCGVGILLLVMFRDYKEEQRMKSQETPASG